MCWWFSGNTWRDNMFISMSHGLSNIVRLLIKICMWTGFFVERVVTVHSPLLVCTRFWGRCCSAIQLSYCPELSGRAVHEEFDGLYIGGQHGRWSVLLRHTHRLQWRCCPFVPQWRCCQCKQEQKRPTPVPSQTRTVLGRVGVGVRDESTESHSVVQPLCLPSVICPGLEVFI